MSTFGSRLRESRERIKLSQEKVAKRIGMRQGLLSELEHDTYTTSGYTPKLAYLYKVNARWLAEGLGPRDISSAEALDDAEVLLLWNKYTTADATTKELVQYLLKDATAPRPQWMSTALAGAIENIRQLVTEQLTPKP